MTPFDDMNRMFDRMTRGFDENWGQGWNGGRGRFGRFSIDLAEYDDELVVVADLPGYDTDELDVSVDDGRLTIAAEHAAEREEGDEGAYLRRERHSASARRTVSLPAEIREADANATYTNGVLTVTLPKLHVEDGDEDAHRIDVD
ncbi:heat shock protein Hsp20 [Candidatus Halobonum tyrrellensis G22]|uniref:Heat shock protein Hsp20 n=2 Tax=Candidatus Halobonum TaxID=1431544 RepID=V4IWZ6_9EURY|nr:heat shock protein Hsp20 [Candidatus Halobonum tyrrellensis G22]